MEITPQQWSPMTKQTTSVLPTRPNHPFFYKWHPAQWDFVYRDVKTVTGKGEKAKTVTKRKGFFIPQVRMERIVPGVNGVHQIQGEIGNPGSRIGKLQQEGWVYLDPQKYDYMHVYPVRGGRFHAPRFMQIKVIANRLIKKMDLDSFHDWSVNLLRSNIFGEIEPHFWELMIYQKSRSRKKEILIKQQHVPEKRAELDIMLQEIKDMKEFIKEFEKRGLDIYADFVNE